MSFKSFIYLIIGFFLVVSLQSCTKLPEPGNVGMEVMKLGNSIPSSWGNLIAVTNAHDSPYVQLWFQDKEGTVYTIVYDDGKNKFSSIYRYIKRM
jgi:hypothetical protein